MKKIEGEKKSKSGLRCGEAQCFAATKAAWPRRSRMAKKATHGFAAAKRDEGTVHMGQNFYFVFESPVFVHRLFRNPNK